MSRVIVIGDIHGCIVEFRDLIDRLGLTSDDRVVCLGDFMDKGPDPAACVRFARESGFESILGNHEERHIRWARHEKARQATGKKNPMRPMSPADAAANEALGPEDWAWLESLPVMLDLGGNWVAVHGGLLPFTPVADQHPKDVIRTRWVRRRESGEGWETVPTDYSNPYTVLNPPPRAQHWSDVWEGPENVVYGHEAFSLSRPRVTNSGVQTWGIDTGAVHGGHLTALILPTMELVQVKARTKYCGVLVPIP